MPRARGGHVMHTRMPTLNQAHMDRTHAGGRPSCALERDRQSPPLHPPPPGCCRRARACAPGSRGARRARAAWRDGAGGGSAPAPAQDVKLRSTAPSTESAVRSRAWTSNKQPQEQAGLATCGRQAVDRAPSSLTWCMSRCPRRCASLSSSDITQTRAACF